MDSDYGEVLRGLVVSEALRRTGIKRVFVPVLAFVIAMVFILVVVFAGGDRVVPETEHRSGFLHL